MPPPRPPRIEEACRATTRVLGMLFAAAAFGCSGTDNPIPPEPTFPPPDPVTIEVPGFPPMPVPEDNPTTRQGIELGRWLFYDTRLSANDQLSCASCHAQAFAFTDHGRRFSVGVDGIEGTRNAPTVVNAAFNLAHFWDGRAATLEDQALQPVENPIELKESWDHVVAKLRADPEYPERFGRAFGSTEITPQRVVQAIAQFERTLVSNDSRYDRWLRGEIELTASELEGFKLFFTETGDCFHCHDRELFSTRNFHDIGLDAVPADVGREAVSGEPSDRGKFKAPSLRNVAFTAPYMHDGRFATLEEVLEHYDSGGVGSPNVDPLIRVGRGLGLSTQQKRDLIAFLHALSDSSILTNPAFANPFEE